MSPILSFYGLERMVTMNKTCKSCGTVHSGNVCPNCGYGNKDIKIKAFDKYKVDIPDRFLTEEQKAEKKAAEEQNKTEKQQNSKASLARETSPQNLKFLIILIIIVIAAAALILVQSGVFEGDGYIDSINSYIEGISERNYDKYTSSMPTEMAADSDAELEKSGLEKSDFMAQLFSDYAVQFGDDYTISVIPDKESREELDNELVSEFAEQYNAAYGGKPEIKKAYAVPCSVTFSGSLDTVSGSLFFNVVKIDGNWFVAGVDFIAE